MTKPGQPFPWPAGATSAASFTFDVDAESAVLAISQAAESRLSVMSHQAYGPRVGVPRLLGLLDRHQIRSTFFVPGMTAERYPGVVRDIAAAGHEIAHHGYRHLPPSSVSVDEEIVELDRGLDILEALTGARPVGYRAPMWDMSTRTPDLLVERGFLYDSSLMDADAPYELTVEHHAESLVEIPLHWALDDWEQYCFLPDISMLGPIQTAANATALWREEFYGLHEAGGCWVLTNHPFLSGRPGRAKELGRLMQEVVQTQGVWVATMAEIASHARSIFDQG